MTLSLTGYDLTSHTLVSAIKTQEPIKVDAEVFDRIKASRDVVDIFVAEGRPVYGVTTGVGSQKNHAIPESEIGDFNRRLIRAHASRVEGPIFEPHIVRGAMLVLLNGFAQGLSGVSPELVKLVESKVNEDKLPSIDAGGSVGASDLVPLAQLADWLLNHDDANAALLPGAKEALSLINSNAFTLSLGAEQIEELGLLLHAFDLVAAMTMEGFRCNVDAISTQINAPHSRKGQREVAARLRKLLTGSKLWEVGQARLLQDPLSFRTVSQTHGAVAELCQRLSDIWDEELNTVNDNPIIDLDTKTHLSHGNMDTTRHALALDCMRLGLGKLADLSGERTQKMQWPAFSDLPIGLGHDGSATGGVQFLNLGHIAASHVTSVKIWAQPHILISVGQLADGVEDTAGHALHSVFDLQRQIQACWKILAIELTVACWAIDRRRIGVEEMGEGLRDIYLAVRPELPIGHEGEAVFEVSAVSRILKAILAQRGCTSSKNGNGNVSEAS